VCEESWREEFGKFVIVQFSKEVESSRKKIGEKNQLSPASRVLQLKVRISRFQASSSSPASVSESFIFFSLLFPELFFVLVFSARYQL
jgi:hypothetical protein